MSETFPQPEREGQRQKPAQSKSMTRREAMRAGLFAALAAAVGDVPNAEAQTRKAALSSWSPEVMPTSDLEKILDDGAHMQPFRKDLEAYQRTLRTSPVPTDRFSAFDRYLVKRPTAFFNMLNKETQEKIREISNRRSVWLSVKDGTIQLAMCGLLTTAQRNAAIEHSKYHSAGGATVVKRNGTYYLQTNLHVIAGIDPRSEFRIQAEALEQDGDDIGFYEISPAQLKKIGMKLEDAVDFDTPLPSGLNPIGAPTFIRGFDPDANLPHGPRIPSGFKEWFGLGIDAGWLQADTNSSAELQRHNRVCARSLAIVVENGESEPRRMDGGKLKKTYDTNGIEVAAKEYKVFARGVSGSGVHAYHRGTIHFTGTVSSSVWRSFNVLEPEKYGRIRRVERDYSTVLFYDRSQIIEALNDPRRIFDINAPLKK